jgi:parallel beta-helix repeat protein
LFGVYLNSSYNDIIISNSISNSRYGIYLYSFSNNKIYLNNFINNTNNVHSSDSTNIWNSTSPITYTYNSNTHTNYFGNYWSDYTGSDADGDGIGEIPYSIDSDKDNYPLMEPFEHYYLESPWPMFRHDAQHTGRSPFVGPGAETPEVHVLVEGGQDNDYISTPIIGSDGTLYLTARITIAGTKEGLFAFNSDGTQKWFFEGQFSMPALLESAKTVYVFPNLGVGSVSAVNTENGILKWNKPYFLPLNLGFPVVGDNGILYFITLRFLPEESYWYLIGLDESGNEVLSYNIGVYRKEYEVSLPTIDKEGTIYLGYNNTLLAINPNGTEKWQRTFIGEYHYRPPTTPSVSTPSIADDGTLYVVVGSESDMDGAIYMYLAHLHAIDPENPTEDKWMRICGEHCSFLSLSSEGNIYLWGSYETSWGWRGLIMGFDSHGNVLENWPLDLSGGGLLLIDKEGYIYGRCSDPNTMKAFNQKGEERWSVYLGRHDDSFLSLGADGTLYAGGRKKLYAIKPFIAQNQPPNPPTNLAQLKSDSETIIPVGATTDERTVIFKGTGSDPDGDKVKLQVELRRLDEYGGQFNETAGGFKESDFVESGNETTAYAYGLIDADYHWRARTVDERGAVSEWMDFGNNDISDADFTVKVSNPPQANAGGPYHGDINEIIQFNGSGTDPDGDAIIGYAWDFDNDGITDSTVQNSTFSWSEAGMYHPTLKVQDARGKWSWLDSCEVNVYEEKPHIGPYPLSMYDRYYVHIFNIDDIGRAYVNGTLVTEVSFGADSSATDITDYLQSGNNEIRFTVENLKEGYTYGFEIIHADGIYHTIWPDSNGEVCGVVGVEGCKDNDQQTGIVYNKTIILELKEREFEDFTFVHLTDVHIGWDARSEFEMHKDYEDLAKEYRESYERFTATLNSINDLNPKPAFILVTGDDVEYNSETFFNGFILAIYSFTRHNDIPFYFIPGNHDRREKMPIIDDYLTNYHKYIPPTIGSDIDEEDYLIKPDNYTFEYGGYLFVGLDSGKDESYAGPQNKIIDWAPEGAGLSTQIIWELVTLEENKKIMPKIIFMHHPAINEDGEDDTEGFPAPVAPNGPGGNDACIANNRELFIEYCTVQKYDVCLVLTGHTHTQKFLDAEGEQVRVYTDGYYGDMKPLFVQTRSATKDDNDNGLTHGFLEVKVGADGIRLIPHPREGVIIPPEHYLCSVTGPVNLHAYDSQGRHTGFGSIDVNIPPAPSTQETIMEQLPQCHK